jgi:hypothetical protein
MGFALLVAACSSDGRQGPTGGNGPVTNPSDSDMAVVGNPPPPPPNPPIANCVSVNPPANGDQDHDGYTPAQGDCNDCDPNINPGATNLAGDPTDYACSGKGGVLPTCDGSNTGKNDPTSLAQSIELCDPRFFKSAQMSGPSDPKARNVLAKFGILKTQKGANMALLSNGVAVDENGTGYVNPQQGTDLGNSGTNPLPNLMGASNCGQGAQDQVNDYTELVLKLHAPSNANSFSFQFQFFSGEYPMYVCSMYNDEFLAIIEEGTTPAANISFDAMMNPITVNSGFFTVCTNDPTKTQTQHCMHPPSDNNGTGYETAFGGGIFGGNIPGGSTGWLTTTAPIKPNEDFTLRFVIFDEGDHILDSAVLIDNFQWGIGKVAGPVTGPITQRVIRHRSASSLMCEA